MGVGVGGGGGGGDGGGGGGVQQDARRPYVPILTGCRRLPPCHRGSLSTIELLSLRFKTAQSENVAETFQGGDESGVKGVVFLRCPISLIWVLINDRYSVYK